MAGFDNEVVYGSNVDFTGSTTVQGRMLLDGQLLIGNSSGTPYISVNNLTAGPGVSITNGPGTITVGLSGGGVGVDSIAVQTGISPVNPDANGLITINGAVTAAGTNPIRTEGTGANTIAVEVQTSQALAAADATKIGLSNFDSSSFAVAATGFVTLAAAGVGKTITGDTGGALSPSSNNWNIVGGPGVTTSGSGSTLTINSVVFTDTTAATLAVDNGYFATAAGAYTLPAAPAQGEQVIIFCDTTGAVAVTANTGQVIRIGSSVSSTAGTLTSTARGDALTLRYRTSGAVWATIASMGNWTVA